VIQLMKIISIVFFSFHWTILISPMRRNFVSLFQKKNLYYSSLFSKFKNIFITDINFEKGNEFFDKKKYKEALDEYLISIKNGYSTYDLHLNSGLSFKALRLYSNAIAEFEKASTMLMIENPTLYLYLATCHYHLKNFDTSLKFCEEALAVDEKCHEAVGKFNFFTFERIESLHLFGIKQI
jgi:tetratricopeptide (TPR) repeat protein